MGNYKLKKEGGLIPNAEPMDIIRRYERINTLQKVIDAMRR